MLTKLAQLKALMAADDWRGALKLAASFPRLGDDAVQISRGWEAYARPEFYRQIGYDIDRLKSDGRAALRRRFNR